MRNSRASKLSTILLLCILGFFVVFAVLIVIVSANIHKSSMDMTEYNFNARTSILYMSEKVRQNDSINSVRVDSFEGSDALVLIEEFDGDFYETWIYLDEGYLSEVFINSNTELISGIGQKIMPIEELAIEKSLGVINFDIIDKNGDSHSSNIYLKCE